jgi:hypothetical protein
MTERDSPLKRAQLLEAIRELDEEKSPSVTSMVAGSVKEYVHRQGDSGAMNSVYNRNNGEGGDTESVGNYDNMSQPDHDCDSGATKPVEIKALKSLRSADFSHVGEMGNLNTVREVEEAAFGDTQLALLR